VHTTTTAEQLGDCQVYNLPSPQQMSTTQFSVDQSTTETIHTALLARIEMLESENASLRASLAERKYFRIEDIQHSNKLVSFYTGFTSFAILKSFFNFLGPVVDCLHYWGDKKSERQRKRPRKIDPLNQLFLTLIKLKLNLKVKDLAFRFGISEGLTSRYITTWICFLYHHLKELEWMPSVDQVWGTLPPAFKEKFPTTFAIIDASEVFIETPSDLFLQSSTWSQYKHHNTFKFLVACTPNGAICFISPVFVGSISDVELTKQSGLLEALTDKPGIAIMADRGFTIKDMLEQLNIELNIPPFLNDRQQLPAKEVDSGRKIAALRIHVERAIGRIKTFNILKETIPITLARLSNQIVYVCAFLSNFQPALVPSDQLDENDVDEYFHKLSDHESESESDLD